jgi:two-component system, cell cycle response regulator DivK
MSLPVVDGWEATRRIKANADTRAIPVTKMTCRPARRSAGHW